MKQAPGKLRKPFRILEWMSEAGLSVTGLAEELGVDPSLISHTIFARKNNRRVLKALRNKGCPREHLDLPKDLLTLDGQAAA